MPSLHDVELRHSKYYEVILGNAPYWCQLNICMLCNDLHSREESYSNGRGKSKR
jgi:hypothetical protein